MTSNAFFDNTISNGSGPPAPPSPPALTGAPVHGPSLGLAQKPPSSAIVRAQRFKSVQTNLSSLLKSVVDVDPNQIDNSVYSFNLGLTRTGREHISPGLILITPGPLLDSGPYDEKSFGEQNDFLFFRVLDRNGRAMDCRYLGVEGSSPLVTMTGISLGEAVTLAIPDYSLACGAMVSTIFSDVLGVRPLAAIEPGPSPQTFCLSPSAIAQAPGVTHLPRASATQVRKFDEFQMALRLIEPQSKLVKFFPDSDSVCAANFEASAVELAIADVHSSHSTGLGKDLMPLSEAELWVVACLRGGAPGKPFPLTKFRSPAAKEPKSASAAVDCLLRLASVYRVSWGEYVATLVMACHGSLVWLITRHPTRFNAAHVVEIFDKVLVEIRLCIREGRDAHLAAVSVSARTLYIERHLMDDQDRYSESGDVVTPWRGGGGTAGGGGAAGGGGGAQGAGAAHAGTKHLLTVAPGAAPPAKVPRNHATFAAWKAADPLKGQNVCASWASNKWGQCANGAATGCVRAHQYPASVSKADQQTFKAWALAKS